MTLQKLVVFELAPPEASRIRGRLWGGFGGALGKLWEALGGFAKAWGGFGSFWSFKINLGATFGRLWETLGEALGRLWEALGKLWETLGMPATHRRTTKKNYIQKCWEYANSR